jgi:3-methyladenine DNA glycosylase AlkC
MTAFDNLLECVAKTQHGFSDILRAAKEVAANHTPQESIHLAEELNRSEVPQAHMLATFVYGIYAGGNPACLAILRLEVSRSPDWRVQEILAKAFDQFCADTGYERALPVIRDWLADPHPNVRRAVTEGLRIWTGRPYFSEHPELAIQLLSALRAEESLYLRKSVGNALRDISKAHPALVRSELARWDLTNKRVVVTYKLANHFLTAQD